MGKIRFLAVLAILILSALLIAACHTVPTPTMPSTAQESEELSWATAPAGVPPEAPALLTTLKRNCQLTGSSVADFADTGLKTGETAVDFTLKDIRGNEFKLSQLLAEKPVMMVFGSFT